MSAAAADKVKTFIFFNKIVRMKISRLPSYDKNFILQEVIHIYTVAS